MRNQTIELDDGPNAETVCLYGYASGCDDPAGRRLLVTVVEAEGETAPAPAGPVTIHLFRDGTFTVGADR